MIDSFYEDLETLVRNNMRNKDIIDTLLRDYPDLSYNCVRSRLDRYLYKVRHKECAIDDVWNDFSFSTLSYDDTIVENDTNFNTISSPVTHSVEYKSDGSATFDRIIMLQNGEDLTPTNILNAHGLDPNKWEIISCKNNYWQNQKKGGTILNLYQSKITVKPSKVEISFDDIGEHFKQLQATYVPHKHIQHKENANYLYEINIADLHLGKLSCSAETGDEFNSEIAKKRFFKIIDTECDRLEKIADKIDTILFVWTNDFFNSDGISGATTKGTPQDNDMRWQKLFLTGCEILVEAIDKLSRYAKVKTFYVASNHSRQVDFYALNYIKAWFKTYPNVEVDVNCSNRYYVKYGVNLLGFAHSYYEKKKNLPYLMSIERPKDWADSIYREFHLAHYHCEKVEERGGIIFRWLPSVTGTDAWTSECGYVGATKRSYSFLYDKFKGLVSINCTTIDTECDS